MVSRLPVAILRIALVLVGVCSPLAASPQPFVLEVGDFSVEGDLGSFRAALDLDQAAPGLSFLRLRLEADGPATPPHFELRWRVPSVSIDAFWNPNIDIDRVNFYSNRLTSRATTQAPVFSLIDDGDRNRLTVAASDALNKLDLATWVKEEDAHFHGSIGFFSEASPARDSYEVILRLDARPVHFAEALEEVSSWWARDLGLTPAAVPDSARQPMYSTWYSFHQHLEPDSLMAELTLAKELGYEAVIVDDGWQTLDGNRGYAYTGDWRPERIPELGKLVDRVHALGMDFLLWYSMPFVGEKADSFSRFSGRFLWHWESQGAWVLDPRYPEVREWIIATYEQALHEWGIDGFKLDFLDRFVPREETALTRADGRDFASVDAAVDRLMTDLLARLKRIRPAVLVEFRQRYTGPLMRQYGNMFRAVDCPNNATANRAETTDLRLLAGNTAVHSDMVMWHADEPVEHAALQLLNVLFSVPQLSVRLTELPAEHREMVGFWTRYWKRNREVLLDGTFRPTRPGAVYPQLRATTAGKTIVAAYGDRLVTVAAGTGAIDVVNAQPHESVVLEVEGDLGERILEVFDTRGRRVSRRAVRLDAGLLRVDVPPSGLLAVGASEDSPAVVGEASRRNEADTASASGDRGQGQ